VPEDCAANNSRLIGGFFVCHACLCSRDFGLLEKVKLCVLDTHWWPVLWGYFFAPWRESPLIVLQGLKVFGQAVCNNFENTCVRFSLERTGLVATRIALAYLNSWVVTRIKASHFQRRTFEIRRHVESVAKVHTPSWAEHANLVA
jgi:hypothetical protein